MRNIDEHRLSPGLLVHDLWEKVPGEVVRWAMLGDDVLSKPVARRVEVFTGAGRRRRWSAEAKVRIVAESYATSVGEVADQYGLSKTQLFTWRRATRGDVAAGASETMFAPVMVVVEVDRRRDAGAVPQRG